MLKIASIIFSIFMITSFNNGWASNLVLNLHDIEIGQRSFSRVYNNLDNFYRLNADQVSILKTENFFEDPKNPSSLAMQALKNIKMNREAYITLNYQNDYRLLKKHLFKIRNCFKEDKTADDLDAPKTTDLLNYVDSLLCIIYALGVR